MDCDQVNRRFEHSTFHVLHSTEALILIRLTTVPVSLRLLLTGQADHFRSLGWRVFTASGPGPEMDGQADHVVLPLTRELSPLRDLLAVWSTMTWFRKVRPQIVHTHTPKAGLIGMLAAWLARVPVRLHTVAGLPEMEAKGLLKHILRWTERVTAACATHVYANSHGLARYLGEQRMVPAGKLSVIGTGSSNGIDTTHFSPTDELREAALRLRRQHGVETSDRLLVFVGRLDDHKGLRELQEAFSTLAGQCPDLHLWLVGPVETARGGLNPTTWRALQHHPRVLLPGFQSDVRTWLLAANIVVFPSYREGFPNVPLQAAALARPVVATDINGCNEIVRPGETGLLIPPKDASALTEAIRYLLDHPAKREAMGQAARPYVVEHYERMHFWELLHDEYLRHLSAAERRMTGGRIEE